MVFCFPQSRPNPVIAAVLAIAFGGLAGGALAPGAAAQTLADGLDQSAAAWKTSQGAEWTYSADSSAYNSGAVRSALNPDAGSSAVWASINGPAQISFYWKTTSSAPAGFLVFFLDDLFYNQISGQTAWKKVSLSIGAGAHTLFWSYLNDASVPGDAGSGWLDHVEIQSLATNPDCIPVLLTASPAVKYPGQMIQITYAIRNAGQAAWSGTWADGLYFSTDDILDASDENLGLYYETQTVDVASSYTRQTTVVLPKVSPGRYYLILSADDFEFITESIEDNNQFALPIDLSALDQFPDLRPTQFSAPDRAQTGTSISISYTIANQGAAAASGPWWDQVILSSDATLDSGDILLKEITGPNAAAAGSSYSQSVSISLPASAPGAYTLFLAADATDSVWESDEDNNVQSRSLPITLEAPSSTPSPTPTPPPGLDSDGDGVSDAYEIAHGTDPYNAASRPALGDFNGDSRVTAADAAARFRYARQHGPRPVSPADASICDLNGDGVEDAADAVILYRWILQAPGYKVIPLR